MPDVRGRRKVELQGSVLIADPNLLCTCLEIEGDFFGDFRWRVGNRKHLNTNLGRAYQTGRGAQFLSAARPQPRDVEGFDAI